VQTQPGPQSQFSQPQDFWAAQVAQVQFGPQVQAVAQPELQGVVCSVIWASLAFDWWQRAYREKPLLA